MRLALLLGLCGLACAQAPPAPAPSTPPPTPTGVASAGPDLPKNWYGAELEYSTSSSPKSTGGFVEASLVSQSAQLYSFTAYDVVPLKLNGVWQFQSSTRTGFCEMLKSYGPFYLFACGNVGAAITGDKVSLATAGEGIVLYKIGKTKWTLHAGYRGLDTGAQGGTRTTVLFGAGRTF